MRRAQRALENLDREIHEHIEQETSDNIARGMPPEEARMPHYARSVISLSSRKMLALYGFPFGSIRSFRTSVTFLGG